MRKIFAFVQVIGLSLLLVILTLLAPLPASTKSSTSPAEIESLLGKLTLRQKIGQMFIFGFSGTELTPTIQRMLVQSQPGSVIVFKHNISSLPAIKKLNQEMQQISLKYTNLPLFIMVDQEGGNVSRVTNHPFPPSALAMGMANEAKMTFEVGNVTGKILRQLGFNMNLAPVVDLSDPTKQNFIGDRSFGSDPNRVKEHAFAFSNGLVENGVLPTFKHYPGHGGLKQDSHKSTPMKRDHLIQLLKKDLIPYRYLAQSKNPAAIMVAHVAFPNIDPSGMPATFSKTMIQDILKDQLGFEGLVMTDDIEMSGALLGGSVGERAIKAVKAGCNMIMVAWSPKRQRLAIDALVKAVERGEIPMADIDQSVRKIIAIKLQLEENSFRQKTSIEQSLVSHKSHLGQLAHRLTQLILQNEFNQQSHLRGSLSANSKVLIFSSDAQFYRSARQEFKQQALFFPIRQSKKLPLAYAFNKHPKATAIYYVTGTGTARKLNALPTKYKQRLIVVNATYPGLIKDQQLFRGIFHIHSRNHKAGMWLARYLSQQQKWVSF